LIIQGLLDIVVNIICTALNALEIFSVPVGFVSAIINTVQYGSYVCGKEILVIAFGSIMSWILIRSTVGIAVFVWKLLPLT
jgi:uncharacterized membrane protein